MRRNVTKIEFDDYYGLVFTMDGDKEFVFSYEDEENIGVTKISLVAKRKDGEFSTYDQITLEDEEE